MNKFEVFIHPRLLPTVIADFKASRKKEFIQTIQQLRKDKTRDGGKELNYE